jgi:hypothetical protein
MINRKDGLTESKHMIQTINRVPEGRLRILASSLH